MADDDEKVDQKIKRILEKKRRLRQILESKRNPIPASEPQAPAMLQEYPALEAGGAPIEPLQPEPTPPEPLPEDMELAGDDSDLAAFSMGVAEGGTSGLAKRAAAKATSAMTGESGDVLDRALGFGQALPGIPGAIASALRGFQTGSGAKKLRDPEPATEMLGPEGKAMLRRHPELWHKFAGEIGAAPTEEQALADAQEAIGKRREESPLMSGLGEFTGGLAQGYYGGKALGPLVGRIPGVSPTGAIPSAGQRATRLATGFGGAAAGAGAEGAVRSAADTAAGEEVNPEQVASDAGVSALIGGAGSVVMPLIGRGARAMYRGMRSDRHPTGQLLTQLEDAGGEMGLLGPKGGPQEEAVRRTAGDLHFENQQLPPDQREIRGVGTTLSDLATDVARRKVVPSIRKASEETQRIVGEENEEFYRTIAGRTPVLPASTHAELRKFVESGEDLAWVKTGTLRRALEAMEAKGALTAREFDEELGGLSREIGYARKNVDDPRLEQLYASMKDDMQRFDEVDAFVREAQKAGLDERFIVETARRLGRNPSTAHRGSGKWPSVPEGSGYWSNLKKRHAKMMLDDEDAKSAFNISGRYLPESTELTAEQINRNVADRLEGFTPGADDKELLRHARRLGILEDVAPVRREAAAKGITSGQPKLIGSTDGGVRSAGGLRGAFLHADPFVRFLTKAAQAKSQAGGGIFLGTQAEKLESALGDMPRNTSDYLLRISRAKKRQEERDEQ